MHLWYIGFQIKVSHNPQLVSMGAKQRAESNTDVLLGGGWRLGEVARQYLFTSQHRQVAAEALVRRGTAAAYPRLQQRRLIAPSFLPWSCPCSAPSLPWDLPGGCLREWVRLASQGFHLVIPPLGIHATPPRLLADPSEAPCPLVRLPACILTHQRRLPIVISTFPLRAPNLPTTPLHPTVSPTSAPPPLNFFSIFFPLILFYVAFVPGPPLSSPTPHLLSLIVCAFLIVS